MVCGPEINAQFTRFSIVGSDILHANVRCHKQFFLTTIY